MTDNKNNVLKCEFLDKANLPKKVCNNGNLDSDCNSNQDCIFRRWVRANKLFQAKDLECESLKQGFEKLYQFNRKIIDEKFKLGCRNARYEQGYNEIERISINAFCLTNGTNKDMSDFAKQIINNINRTKEENQCEQ